MKSERFPFGRYVKPVLPTASGRRRVFVLGVYPSAIHAKWRDPKGNLWPALAVDNEPEPFWTGEDAKERVTAIAKDVPTEAGYLEPADRQHNGASGVVVDNLYLKPLEIGREECWITDLVQSYLANDGQFNRISKSYAPLVDEGIVPAAKLRRRVGKVTNLPDDRKESLRREFEEASPELVITLGNEPLQCLALDPLDPSSYGTEREVPVLGSRVRLLALVHPRQSGALGQSSPKWTSAHREWVGSVGHA